MHNIHKLGLKSCWYVQRLLLEEVGLGVSDLQEAIEESGSSALILKARNQSTRKAKAAAKARETGRGSVPQHEWGILGFRTRLTPSPKHPKPQEAAPMVSNLNLALSLNCTLENIARDSILRQFHLQVTAFDKVCSSFSATFCLLSPQRVSGLTNAIRTKACKTKQGCHCPPPTTKLGEQLQEVTCQTLSIIARIRRPTVSRWNSEVSKLQSTGRVVKQDEQTVVEGRPGNVRTRHRIWAFQWPREIGIHQHQAWRRQLHCCWSVPHCFHRHTAATSGTSGHESKSPGVGTLIPIILSF